jgi:hypothetical protein
MRGEDEINGRLFSYIDLQQRVQVDHVRYGSRGGAACAEFSWGGSDDNSHASGRGWAAIGTTGRLVGYVFIHKGDESGFVAERECLLQQPAGLVAFRRWPQSPTNCPSKWPELPLIISHDG